ncbi:MAG: hypothetical protein ACLSAH_01255, partial [Bilophila wadsworthia]
ETVQPGIHRLAAHGHGRHRHAGHEGKPERGRQGACFDLPDGFSEYAAGDALPLLARRRDQHRQQGIILHGFGAGVQPGHFKRDGFRCGRRDQAYSHG